MAQTSMQQLIQWMNDSSKVIPFNQGDCYDKALELLETEKEELMDAFQAGKWDWSEHSNNGKHSMDPAEYYNKTFKKD